MSISNILTSRAYSAYEAMLRKEVLASPVPKHIAVIMDGNRRYAEERGRRGKRATGSAARNWKKSWTGAWKTGSGS